MAAKKKVKTAKVKKKKWVSIYAPKIFNNAFLGDTHVTENEQVIGKHISLNLGTVMNDMKKQNYHVRCDVASVKDNKAQTTLVGLHMTPSGAKRLIRRGRTKIEDSFLAKLKTGQVVRVKPLIVTINNCSKATATAIRHAIKAKLQQVLAEATIDSFVDEIIGNKIQRVLKTIATESHPTRTADIRSVGIVPGSRSAKVEEELEVEEPEAEEAEAPAEEEAPKKTAKKKAAKKTVKKEEAEEEKPEEPAAEEAEAPAEEEKAEEASEDKKE